MLHRAQLILQVSHLIIFFDLLLCVCHDVWVLKVLFHVDAPLINLSPMIMEHIVTLLEVPVLHAQVA